MKRDAREDKKLIADTVAWVFANRKPMGFTKSELKILDFCSALDYWMRRAEALESLLLNNLDDIALHDFCPDHECGGGGCKSKDAEEAIDCRAWCWQKAVERCGEEKA